MAYKKKTPGDPLRIRAAWYNAVTDLVNKQAVPPPPFRQDDLYVGCLRCFIGTSDPNIEPFTLVSWGQSVPPTFRGMDYMLANSPIVEVTKDLTWYGPLGITQTPVKNAGKTLGYVKTHGVSWVKVPTDAYNDISAGYTHINIYPGGTSVRGSMAGPIRVISKGESPYLQVEIQSYKPPTLLVYSPRLGIPARSGTTPGSASCELVFLFPQTNIITYSGASETIYNMADSAVEGNTLLQAKIDGFSGQYVVDWEECPSSIS